MSTPETIEQLKLYLPPALKKWIADKSKVDCRSLNKQSIYMLEMAKSMILEKESLAKKQFEDSK